MNERTQTRLAWALSACFLAAGWLWRQVPEASGEAWLGCADSTPRTVAVVVESDGADSPAKQRVHVYWLSPGSTSQPGSAGPVGEPGHNWTYAGSAPLGKAPTQKAPAPRPDAPDLVEAGALAPAQY